MLLHDIKKYAMRSLFETQCR